MPNNTLISSSLTEGLRQIALGNYRQVHTSALNMIKKDVSNAVPYCLLATIATDHGNHFKACELFEKAAELDPQGAHYHAFLGQILTTIGRQNKAKEAVDAAASLPCNNAHILDTIGVVYSRTGYHEKAIPFFERAVVTNPAPANFHYNLAASLQFLGEFDNAESAYKEALKRDPKSYRAWSSIVGLSRQTEKSNHLKELKSLFKEFSTDADARLHLGHAMAKTLEDLGRYEESLDWLHKAKQLKKSSSANPRLTGATLFESAKRTVEPIIAAKSSVQSATASIEAPIFIIGLPRTGTTLVDRILSSHSQVTAAGELNIFPGLIKEASGTQSNMVMDDETLALAGKLNLNAIGHAYINDTKELGRGAARMTDKMPLNFFYAGLIHQALPNARIIALRRGAMDSCLSNYRQLLTVQHSYYHYTYDLAETAAFYRSFDQLMTHWRVHLPAQRFMEIQYEDIVFDQENQTRKLLSFCDLEWDDACLRFHENLAPVSTASSVQVRQPLYSGSIGRWKHYGNKLKLLEEALGDLVVESND